MEKWFSLICIFCCSLYVATMVDVSNCMGFFVDGCSGLFLLITFILFELLRFKNNLIDSQCIYISAIVCSTNSISNFQMLCITHRTTVPVFIMVTCTVYELMLAMKYIKGLSHCILKFIQTSKCIYMYTYQLSVITSVIHFSSNPVHFLLKHYFGQFVKNLWLKNQRWDTAALS